MNESFIIQSLRFKLQAFCLNQVYRIYGIK